MGSMESWSDFEEIWVVDYEFHFSTAGRGEGGIPIPICYCAKEIISGREIRQWIDNDTQILPEYMKNENGLFLAYASVAEMSCHVALNIPFPSYMIDLFTEFLLIHNGRYKIGNSLLNACEQYEIVGGDAPYKDTMRDLILSKSTFTEEEKSNILEYCFEDVYLTCELFEKLKDKIDVPHALLRGRYTYSIAKIENTGIPINMDLFNLIKDNSESIKEKLINELDTQFHVYEGTKFKNERFLQYIQDNQIPWDLTKTGLPLMNKDYLEDKVKSHVQLRPLFELRRTLGQARLIELSVGPDGRNRSALMPNLTKTQRNRPSSNRYIFGAPSWQRHLIKPGIGMALSYIDYEQEEFAIAASLSGDDKMMSDYKTSDPYIEFAKRAGAVPKNATKKSHPDIRNQYKQCVLSLQYGAGVQRVASQAGVSLLEASDMITHHKNIYHKFWDWIEKTTDNGKVNGEMETIYGWKICTRNEKATTLQNFPIQAHGSDLLRLSTCYGIESGLKICALIHDAVMIESTIEQIDDDTQRMQQIMKQASIELFDFEIFTDAKIIKYPDTYVDERNTLMYNIVCKLVGYA
jgi:DNA polymerase I